MSSGRGAVTPAAAGWRRVATTSPSPAVSSTDPHGNTAWTPLTACNSTNVIRPFHHSQFPPELLRERKRDPITVVLPTRQVADTIGPIVERLTSLGLIDQILVVDAASGDGTAELAASLGADVHQETDLLPEYGQVRGKGDAMWRALDVAVGELIVYLDSDTRDFSPHFATGMLGPLICHPDDVRFVKGHFRRPYTTPEAEQRPIDGGRVTELTA